MRRPLPRWVMRLARRGVRLGEPVAARLARSRLPLPAWLLLPLAHETADARLLERLAERATERLAAGASGRFVRRLGAVALLRRGRIALDARDDHDALAWFDRAHTATGPTAETWTWQAVVLRRLGRLDDSRAAGEQAVVHDPAFCPALVHLGILYHQIGDRTRSVEVWRQLLDVPTPRIEELRWAWIELTRMRQLELALATAERMAALAPSDPRGAAARAVTLTELGRDDDATRIVAGFEADGGVDARRALAFYYGRTGRSARAREVLAPIPVTDQGRDTVLELVLMLREDGHLRAAAEVAGHAAEAVDDTEFRRLRDEGAGELAVHDGSWTPPDGPVATIAPTRGRVLHVVGRSLPYVSSGYAVRTDHTVRAQRRAGVDAQVATQLGFPWEEGRDAPIADDVDGVVHHRLPIPADARRPLAPDERLTRHVEALTALVEKLRPAALHVASDFRNGLVGQAVAERFDLPMIYEMRGFWEETWLAKHGEDRVDADVYTMRRERERAIAAAATHVFTLAPTMRDVLVERGIAPEKISLAPNAVDPDDFPEPVRDDALAAELGIADGTVVVGYVSSFVGYEGIHVLIDALAACERNVVGLLVGDGLVRPELERRAREAGIADRVIFTGRVPHADVAAYYGLIDIFVVPRTNARVCRLVSPLKPYEAMASARAMIVSATPVLTDIVEDGVTGATFTPEDAADLAAVVTSLADDPQRRRALGIAAREKVLSEHTWERNAERYLAVYRDLGIMGAGQPSRTGEG